MKALRLNKVGSLEGIGWENVPDPIVGDYDVLVKIKPLPSIIEIMDLSQEPIPS